MIAHSYTRVHLFLTCGAAYEYYVVKKTPAEESEILQAGALSHKIFERYIRHCHGQRLQSDITEIAAIGRTAYNETRQKYADQGRPFLGEVQFENIITDLIEPFAATHMLDFDTFGDVELELAFTVALKQCGWLSPNVWWRSKIDFLSFLDEKTARVTDYKTGWNTDAEILQMRIYAWNIFAAYPSIQEVQTEFDYVRFNIQKQGVFYREADFEAIDLQVRGYAKRIETAKSFPHTPGPHCAYCNYAGKCQAKPAEPAAIIDLAQAQRAVEAICLLERQLKDHKEHLRSWVETNGNVIHNGADWGFHAVGGLGFDSAEAFFHAAKKDGVKDPFEYMSVSRDKCKKLRDRKTDEYSGHLAEVAVNQRSVRFEGKKA